MLTRTTRSGLAVAEHGYDERAMQKQLERMDDRLVLTTERHPSGKLEYVVVKTRGDRDAVEICRWRDSHGSPLPLSSGLLVHVARLDANSRNPYDDPAEHNDRLQAAVRREMDNAAADAARDFELRHGRIPAFHRSRALYLSRQKQKGRP